MAFEHAWDLLDFDVVYRMSGPELHDGMRKAQFVAAKRAAYAETPRLGRLVARGRGGERRRRATRPSSSPA